MVSLAFSYPRAWSQSDRLDSHTVTPISPCAGFRVGFVKSDGDLADREAFDGPSGNGPIGRVGADAE